MNNNWKILKSEIVFEPHIRMQVRKDIVKLPNNKIVDDFYLWVEGDVVLIIPITKEGKFILVKQYKHGAGKVVIEFPAGMLDPDEKPDIVARRELLEETGYTGEKFQQIAVLHNHPTKVVGKIHVFCVREVCQKGKQQLDENEDIEVLERSKKEVLEMILKGEIIVTGTISAFFLVLKKLVN